MGLFDRLLKPADEKLNDRDAFAGIALTAVSADGVLAEEEALLLTTTFSRMKLFRDVRESQLRQGLERLAAYGKEHGNDALIDECARTVPAELRPTAFAVAADLLLADGVVTDGERRYLERLQKALGVGDDLALKIVDVLAVKNKG